MEPRGGLKALKKEITCLPTGYPADSSNMLKAFNSGLSNNHHNRLMAMKALPRQIVVQCKTFKAKKAKRKKK